MFSNLGELALRFVVGGVIVTAFAVLAEIFRPKSFAGLFGAAPSIALATMGITIVHHGKAYAGLEARSMVFGAVAFFCYASSTSWLLMRLKPSALTATVALLPIWLVASLSLFWLASRF